MEIVKDGDVHLIDDEQQLYSTIQSIDDVYSSIESTPVEDTLMANLIYGDNENEKKKYLQKVCTYKKYTKICEYSIAQGDSIELDTIKVLEESMKLACCSEEEINNADLFLKGLYLQKKGKDFVREAYKIVEPMIARNRKDIVTYSSPELKQTFEKVSKKLGTSSNAVKLVMLMSNDGELSKIVKSIKEGTPRIDEAKLEKADRFLKVFKLTSKNDNK